MVLSLQQVQIDALIARATVNDRELGEILGVNQSTAWCIRKGRIKNLNAHILRLRAHFVELEQGDADDDASLVADLVTLSARVPALKAASTALRDIMRDNA